VKIVVISPRFPYPLEKGDKLRLYYHLRSLSNKYEITLISLSDCEVSEASLSHIGSIVSKVHLFRLKKTGIFFRLFKGIFSKLPFQIHYFFDPSLKPRIESIIENENPDFIFNQLIRTAEYTKDLKYYKVIDYMDSFSQGMKKRFDSSFFPGNLLYKIEYERVKRYEAEIFQYFDRHIIISDQDRQTFSDKINKSIAVKSNGVDTGYFSPTQHEKEYELGFIGNMGYRPNVLAAIYLAKNILPLLKTEFPKIRLLIAGARPDRRVKALESESVRVTGWMEDIRDAYSTTGIFVSPIFTGIGQQNKILEAMAMQIPVITTSSVNNPIGAQNEKEILLADNENEFVENIIRLLKNPEHAASLGRNGRKFVVSNYNWSSSKSELFDIFNK
jgi:sugar transferase (PEP-CTERM/EpsH1 system associated)